MISSERHEVSEPARVNYFRLERRVRAAREGVIPSATARSKRNTCSDEASWEARAGSK
jgi:hypothetical protein